MKARIILSFCLIFISSINLLAGDLHPIAITNKTLHCELAVTAQERAQGLMHRGKLEADKGMLFVLNKPQRVGFWMKDTRIPLDLGYFDSDGILLEIYTLRPYDKAAIYSKSHKVQYAIEANQGWFRKNGIRIGDALTLNSVDKAISTYEQIFD